MVAQAGLSCTVQPGPGTGTLSQLANLSVNQAFTTSLRQVNLQVQILTDSVKVSV